MNGFLVLLVVLGTTNAIEIQQQKIKGSQGWKIAENKDYFAPRTEGPTDYQNVERYTRDVGSTGTMAPNVKPEDVINPAGEEEPAHFNESELKHKLNKELIQEIERSTTMAPNVDLSNIIKETMVSSLPKESAHKSEPPKKQRNNRDVSHILDSNASMAPNKSPDNFSSKAWDSGSPTMLDATSGGTQPSVEIDEILTREVLQIFGGIATMAPNGQQEVIINQNTPIEPIEGSMHNFERVGRDISHILREKGTMAPNVKLDEIHTQNSPDHDNESNKTGTPSTVDLTNGESQKPLESSTSIMASNVQREDTPINLGEHRENNANKNTSLEYKNSNSQNPERFGRDVSHLVVGVVPVESNVEKEDIPTQISPNTGISFNNVDTPNAEDFTNGESQKLPKFSTSIMAPNVQREDTPTNLNKHRENVINKNTPVESKNSNAQNPERFGRDVSHLVVGVAPVAPNVEKEDIPTQISPNTGISFNNVDTPNADEFANGESQKLPTTSLSTMAPNVQQEDTLTDLSDHRENIINKNTPAESKNPNLQNIARFVRNVSHILEGSATLASNVKKEGIPTQTSSDTGISFNKAKTVNAEDFAKDESQQLPTASFSTMAPNVQQKDTLPKPSDLKRSGTQQKPIIFRDDQLPDTLISEVFNPKAPVTSEIVKVQKSVQIQIPQTCMATFRSVRNAILRPKPISNLSLIQGVLNCLTDITEEELKEGHQHHSPEDVAEDVIRHSDFQYFLGEKHPRSQVEGRSNVGEENTPKFLIDRKIDGIIKEDEEKVEEENTPYFYDPQILPKDFPRRVAFEGPQFSFSDKNEDEIEEKEEAKQQVFDETMEIATNSRGTVNDLGHTINSLLLEDHQEPETSPKDTANENLQDLDKPSDLRLCHESGEKLISLLKKSLELHAEVGNSKNGHSLSAEGAVLDVLPEAIENHPSISTHRLARDVSHLFGNLKKSKEVPKNSANGPSRPDDQPAVDLPYIFVSRLRDAQNLKVGENSPPIQAQRQARDVSNWLAPKLRDILKAQGSSNFRSAGQTKIPALECGMSAPSADSHLKESMAENVASSPVPESGPSATPLRLVRDVSKLLASRLKRFRKTEDSSKTPPKPGQEDNPISGSVMAVQPPAENISHLKYPDMAVTESGSSPSADRKIRDVSHLLQPDQDKFPHPKYHDNPGDYASKSIDMPDIVIVTPIPPLEDSGSLTNGPSLPILPLDFESSILSVGPQVSEFLELNRLLPPSLPENSEATADYLSKPIENRIEDVASQPLADMPSSSPKLDAINSGTLEEDSQQFEKNVRGEHPLIKTQIKVDVKDLMELEGRALIKPEVDTLSVGSQVSENVEIKQLGEPSIPKNEKTIGNEHLMATENPLQDVAPQNQNLNPESLVEIVQNIERKVRDISHLLKTTSTVAPIYQKDCPEDTTTKDKLQIYSVDPQVPEYLEVNQLLPPSLPQNSKTPVSNNSLSIDNRTQDGATTDTKKWPENSLDSNNTESMESQATTLPNLKDNNMENSMDLEKNLEEIENIMAIKREERDVSHLLGMLDSQMNLKVTLTHSNPEHEALDPIDEHSRDIALLFGVDDTNNREHGNTHQTGQRKSREVQNVGHIDELPLAEEPIAFNGGNEVSGPLDISIDPENNIMDVLQRIQRSSGEKLVNPTEIADQIVEDDPYVENILLKPVAKEYNFRAFHKKFKRSAELAPEDPMEIHSTPIPAKSEDMTTVTPDLPKSTIKSPRSKLPLTVFATRPKRFKDSQPKPVRKMPFHSTVNIIRPKKLRKPI